MKYILEIDERERATIILACGRAWDIAQQRNGTDGWLAEPNDIARKLLELAPATPTRTEAGFVTGHAQPSSPQARVEAPAASNARPAPQRVTVDPDAVELGPITPTSIIKSGVGKKERLTVDWREGAGVKRASCWSNQKAIWPRVLERVKLPTVFLVKQSGVYLSIVGVKS